MNINRASILLYFVCPTFTIFLTAMLAIQNKYTPDDIGTYIIIGVAYFVLILIWITTIGEYLEERGEK